jgi:hypothetical protein
MSPCTEIQHSTLLGAKLKRFRNLTLVDAIEQMAVVDPKTRPPALLVAQLGQHHIKAGKSAYP